MFTAHLSPRDIDTPSCGLGNLDETERASEQERERERERDLRRGWIPFEFDFLRVGLWVVACTGDFVDES